MSGLYEVIAIVLVGWCAVFIAGWGALALRSYKRKPLLRYELRREPPWGVGDLLFVFGLVFLPQMFIAVQFQPLLKPGIAAEEVLKELLRWNALISVISFFGVITYLELRPQASIRDVGLNAWKPGYQVALGLGCFVLVAPAVYGVQFVFVKLLDMPSEHPLIELVKNDATAFRMSAFVAVVMAPISEELLFRGLLQGWLERLSLFEADVDSMLLGTRQTDEEDDLAFQARKGGKHPVAWMPIMISSTVFAIMHYSHGPDPIALFFLAIALGYVYQRTHCLLPCIIVHMCLNGTTMLMLWASMQAPAG